MLHRLFAVVLVGALGGCSFVTMHSPSGPGPPQCEDGYLYPAIDTIVAIAAPFLIYQSFLSGSSKTDDQQVGAVIGTFLIGVPVAGVEATSAIYGFIKRDRCERAKRDYVQLVTPPPYLVPAPPPQPYPPQPYPPPPPPPPSQQPAAPGPGGP